MKLLNYFRGEAFQRGIHPPSCKLTAETPIRRLPYAPYVVVPLSQHIGKAPHAIVRVGEEVVRGQPIARTDDWLSVPHHAPVTGVVEAIELRPSARGPWAPAIVIRTHPGASQEDLWGQERNLDDASPADLLQMIWDTGMVGLGGAAFPTHAKLTVPKQAKAHTLVVNGCECEPYLTCDHRVMVEEADDLIQGIRYALRVTGAVRAIVGVEDNKPEAVRAIQSAIDRAQGQTPEGEIFVEAVPTKYPQGAEKMLITALFGVEVPSGGLPIQLGMVVNNVGTLAALGRLLPAGQGLTERVVTVTGPGVERPGDYRVPLGTPLSFVLNYAGAPADSKQVILGGPMMGQSAPSLDVPITKGVSGVLVFKGDDIAFREQLRTYPCIKCGECVESCPMGLNPSQLGMLAAKREYELMGSQYHLGDCFECGCCTYVCPSSIPLVQQFRVAKQVLRERAVV